MIFSLIVFAFVALITYWWASSGAWSAFLHMVCVIVAGAVALALWEPVSYLLLTQNGFNGYARGGTLLALFLVLLLVLRLAMDRLVPANMEPPKALSLALGLVFGAVSGVLTMGLVVIGCGFIQSSTQLFDVAGYVRRSDVPRAPTIGSDGAPVLHLVEATTKFYAFLSAGSFTPWLGGGTLDMYQPELTKSSLSLYRDSYSQGEARVSLSPTSVSGLEFFDAQPLQLDPGVGAAPVPAYAVHFTVSQDAYDGTGTQFVLSASQARLVGAGRNGKATVAYPQAWRQSTGGADMPTFYFNSPANYATSQPPGSGESTYVLLFPQSDLQSQEPKFFELKGVRFRLPAAKTPDASASADRPKTAKLIDDPDATALRSEVESPEPTYSLPVTLNSNSKGALKLDEANYILSGSERFDRHQTSIAGSDLRIRGFKPPEGTRIIRIDASAVQGGVRLFPDVNQWVRDAGPEAQDARVVLVDALGSKYYAIGFAEDDGLYLTVTAASGRPLRLRDIPIQTLGTNKKLLLYFAAPNGSELRQLGLDTPSGVRVTNTLSFKVKQATD